MKMIANLILPNFLVPDLFYVLCLFSLVLQRYGWWLGHPFFIDEYCRFTRVDFLIYFSLHWLPTPVFGILWVFSIYLLNKKARVF